MNRHYVAMVFALGIAAALSAWSATSLHAKRSIAAVSSDGIKKVVIHAGPGQLVVRGAPNDSIAVTGEANAENEADLAKLQLTSRRDGDAMIIESASESTWHWWSSGKAWLDTEVVVPNSMQVEIYDGSGDLEVAGTGQTQIDDGSGN